MKKILAIFFTFAMLTCAFILPAHAVETEYKFYDEFISWWYHGKTPSDFDMEILSYDELYYHYTDGEIDWALVQADSGVHLEVETCDIMFGRAFANNDIATPFTYTYGIYDAAKKAFFDLDQIGDGSQYPDLQEVFDEFHVGNQIQPAQYGDNLLFKDEFMKTMQFGSMGKLYTAEQTVKYYDELYYHDTEGVIDWALVKGESWFKFPYGGTYNVIGDRVFKTDGIYEPFGNSYAVYHVATGRFYDLRDTLVNPKVKISAYFPDLQNALDELNLGEKIGDVNGDGKVNVKDATEMQRCLSEYCDYPASDGVEAAGFASQNSDGVTVAYLSDVDKSGTRDIRDVTAMQRIAAEIDK